MRIIHRMLAGLVCIGSCVVFTSAFALENVRFNRLSVEQGLSQSAVQSIAQDREGFIWLGTQQGLNRFDGYDFAKYFHDPADENSLSHDWIWALHLDGLGNLWVGTDKGLSKVELATGQVQRFNQGEDTGSPGRYPIRVIDEDSQGRLWLGSDGGGLIRFEPASGTIRRFLSDPENPNSIGSNRVKALYVDASGFVWIGSDGGGLNRLDPISERVSRIDLPDNDGRVRFITADAAGDIWVATNERGLYRLNSFGNLKQHYTAADGRGLSSDAIRVLFVDAGGDLWVGTDSHGINRYDVSMNTFSTLRHQPANVRSLSEDHVSSMFQDRGGVIWVGTQAGVNTWNPQTGVFSTFARLGLAESELSNNWVSSFAEGPNGHVYVGTAGGGVDLVDLDTGRIERVGAQDGPLALNDVRVFALAVTNENQLWAGTRAGGLNRYDPQSGGWHAYQHDPEDPQSLSFDGVTSLLLDAEGNLWAGTYGGGLNRYLPETDGFQHVRHDPSDPTSLCSDRVLSVYEDRGKALWVGTHGDGLCRMDPDTGKFETYRHDPQEASSLSSNDAWKVIEDGAGNLWIGTSDGGLNVFRAADRQRGVVKFTRIGVAEGLASNVVYGLESDTRGRIWASGNRGLSRVELDTGSVRRFSVVDGLQGNEFNFAAAFRSRDGRLFFGGLHGFNAFYPHEIGANTYAPPIALTRFLRLNEETNLDALRDENDLVTFRHTDRLVTFEYAALDFTDPQSNSYEHRLDGFDEGWVQDGNRHRLTYTNLLPGKYTLRVRAANKEGVRSESEFRVPFQVLPAPWVTWWAQTGYLLGILLVAFMIYRVYARRMAYAMEIQEINDTLLEEITARKGKEVELKRSEQQAQKYLDVVEVIILALDADGAITMINQKGTRVLGCSEQEILGKDFYEEFVPGEYRKEVREHFETVDQYVYSESPVKPRHDAERLIAWHTIELFENENTPAGILISGTDISQMRSMEKQLWDAQKMEALGTLARGVAHDFNNILGSVLGYAELGLAASQGSKKAKEHLGNLEKSVDKARVLIKRILSFGRSSGERPQPVRVSDVVREALQLVEPGLGSNIRIETSLERDCGAVLADPMQLEQVLLNLCTNAGQAMSETGGSLIVEVNGCEVGVEQARATAVLLPGPHVKIVVSDTGPGMDDYTLARIFDPFFTTRRQDGSTGLGLALVHGIVTQLKGTVRVRSKLGEGSHFEIYLPCCLEIPLDPLDEEQTPVQSLVGNETVLFVDDEPALRSIAEEALTSLGYRVFTAEDGAAALELYASIGNSVDIVITDQTMPNMLGLQLAEHLRKRKKDLPIILMSGADWPPSEAVDYFMEKPFTIETLAKAVRSVLAETS